MKTDDDTGGGKVFGVRLAATPVSIPISFICYIASRGRGAEIIKALLAETPTNIPRSYSRFPLRGRDV